MLQAPNLNIGQTFVTSENPRSTVTKISHDEMRAEFFHPTTNELILQVRFSPSGSPAFIEMIDTDFYNDITLDGSKYTGDGSDLIEVPINIEGNFATGEIEIESRNN